MDVLEIHMVREMGEVLKIALAEPIPGRIAAVAESVEVEPLDDTITH
jgi:hypothetical protein